MRIKNKLKSIFFLQTHKIIKSRSFVESLTSNFQQRLARSIIKYQALRIFRNPLLKSQVTWGQILSLHSILYDEPANNITMLVRFGSSQAKPPTALVYIPHFTIRRNIISQNLLRMSSVVPTSMLIETQNIPLMIPILFGHSILWSRNKVKLAPFVQSKKMQSIVNKTSFRNTNWSWKVFLYRLQVKYFRVTIVLLYL